MFGTVESTHNKIIEKINITRKSIMDMRDMVLIYRNAAERRNGRKYSDIVLMIDGLYFNQILNELESIENQYTLAVVGILSDYYNNVDSEENNTKVYYRIITSENFVAKIHECISKVKTISNIILKIVQLNVLPKSECRESEYELNKILKSVDYASNIDVGITLEKNNYEICKCGTRMTVVPELSELHCGDCTRVKSIWGAVFRDDQFYPQEGQKTKHGGYDTSRHYRFWMERLQALENKVFSPDELNKIGNAIKRDGYNRHELNCRLMREILEDPEVNLTHLNDHSPLLVKTFGGAPPPRLDFHEDRLTSIRFNKVMKLYDIVNPNGGNKPYYPYFIYKILEHMFKDNPEKLRLLNYVHMQSRETVIKNDKYYQKICELSDPRTDGLVYTPTDPGRTR
jgi:hypothetical protein